MDKEPVIKVEIPQNFVFLKWMHGNNYMIVDPRPDHEPDIQMITNIMKEINDKIKGN